MAQERRKRPSAADDTPDKPAPPERLVQLRRHVDILDAAMLGAESRELAALARERRLTLAEIEALEAEGAGAAEVSLSDQLAQARQRRLAAPSGGIPPAERRGQSRRSAGNHRTG